MIFSTYPWILRLFEGPDNAIYGDNAGECSFNTAKGCPVVPWKCLPSPSLILWMTEWFTWSLLATAWTPWQSCKNPNARPLLTWLSRPLGGIVNEGLKTSRMYSFMSLWYWPNFVSRLTKKPTIWNNVYNVHLTGFGSDREVQSWASFHKVIWEFCT